MTLNEDEIDQELLPDKSQARERIALVGSLLVAIMGLAAYSVAMLPDPPVSIEVPHLLGVAILMFGIGSGSLTVISNFLFNPVINKYRAIKVGSLFALITVLLAPLVNAGAFHPRLAIVFIVILSSSGILYAILGAYRFK